MNVPLEAVASVDKSVPMREVIANLQQTLQRNHQKILAAARHDWEQTYGRVDPTTACVSIRITTKKTRKLAPSVSGLN